jgi:2-hydroxychromene-2-carboxylate isomerase
MPMAAPIEFWFDFSSPYSYLASEKIEELAARHGRGVAYRPTLLGVIFRTTGGVPLTELVPPKASYFAHDFARSARFAGVPYRKPSVFPIATVNAARAFLWLQEQDEALAARFLHAAFRGYFSQDRSLAEPEVLNALAIEVGADPVAMARGMQEPAIKERLKARTAEAVEHGVFGVPTFPAEREGERELFWGHDRLPQVERWLATGPF